MKTSFLKSAVLVSAVALLAACGGQAQAQTQTLSSQVSVGAGATVNLASAYNVSLAPGNQYVVDGAGRKIPVTFKSASQVATALARLDYADMGNGMYANLTKVSRVFCTPEGSYVDWLVRVPETLPDGCAFAYRVESFSR